MVANASLSAAGGRNTARHRQPSWNHPETGDLGGPGEKHTQAFKMSFIQSQTGFKTQKPFENEVEE